jgi:hypothetical protein
MASQIVLKLSHGCADLRTTRRAARELERRDPHLVEQIGLADGAAAALGQGEIADFAVIVLDGSGGDAEKEQGSKKKSEPVA